MGLQGQDLSVSLRAGWRGPARFNPQLSAESGLLVFQEPSKQGQLTGTGPPEAGREGGHWLSPTPSPTPCAGYVVELGADRCEGGNPVQCDSRRPWQALPDHRFRAMWASDPAVTAEPSLIITISLSLRLPSFPGGINQSCLFRRNSL